MKNFIKNTLRKIRIWRVKRLDKLIADLDARIYYWEKRDYQLNHTLSPYRYAEIEAWEARVAVLCLRQELLIQKIKKAEAENEHTQNN
jgi:hypothetical protein